jgi:hypothetical protein
MFFGREDVFQWIENSLAVQAGNRSRRRINLDPGYVTEAKVVLATTKDYSHRLYIGKGIYAEVTLRYGNKDRSFIPFDHTYLDYGSEMYITMFNTARDLLRTLQRPEEITRQCGDKGDQTGGLPRKRNSQGIAKERAAAQPVRWIDLFYCRFDRRSTSGSIEVNLTPYRKPVRPPAG